MLRTDRTPLLYGHPATARIVWQQGSMRRDGRKDRVLIRAQPARGRRIRAVRDVAARAGLSGTPRVQRGARARRYVRAPRVTPWLIFLVAFFLF